MSIQELVSQFGTLIVFAPLLMGSLFGLAMAIKGYLRIRNMLNWPLVRTTVTSAEAEYRTVSGIFGRKVYALDLVVDFEYRRQGKPVTGTTEIELAIPRSPVRLLPEDYAEAVETVRRPIMDKGLDLRIDPSNPDNVSANDPDMTREIRSMVLFSALCVVFGYLTFV